MNGEPVAVRQLGHHVVAEETGGSDGQVAHGRNQRVRAFELLFVHPDAGVDDRDHVTVVVAASVDLDLRVRRRERQRILDELGDHVADIGRSRTVDMGFVDVTHVHPAVALDLAQRAPHDISHGNRCTPRARRRQARENQQRLGIAPHARREMVEAEEMLEGLRVGLVVLELGDELELAGEEVLVATAQVDVRVGDVLPQRRLLDGEGDRAVLHHVERDLDLVHLAARVHAHGLHLGSGDGLVDR